MSKKILVTGGLGFIGTNLIQKLLKTTDDSFIILDAQMYKGALNNLPRDTSFKKRITFISGDITKKKNVEKVVEQVQVIIHLAASTHTATSFKKPTDFIKTNVIGTARLLDAAFKYSVDRFIYISSSEVYGNRQKHEKMDEKHPFAPISPYAVTKLAADRLVYSYHLTKKLPVVILRPFNTYGPRMRARDGRVMPNFIRQALNGDALTLYGDGSQTRSFCYVDDMIRGLIGLMEAVKFTYPVNWGNPSEITVRDLAKTVLRLTRSSSEIVSMPLPQDDPVRRCPDISKAVGMLGFKPEVDLEQGLQKTIDFFRPSVS